MRFLRPFLDLKRTDKNVDIREKLNVNNLAESIQEYQRN